MKHPVVHFEIQSERFKELHGFYSELFGWEINADNPIGYGIARTHAEGDVGIDGGIGGTGNGGSMVTFYVQSDDLEASLKKAESLGGKVVMPVTTIPGMVTLALFADLDGNVVGLVHSDVP